MNLCDIFTYDTGKSMVLWVEWKAGRKTEDKNQLGANYNGTGSSMEIQSYLRSWFDRTWGWIGCEVWERRVKNECQDLKYCQFYPSPSLFLSFFSLSFFYALFWIHRGFAFIVQVYSFSQQTFVYQLLVIKQWIEETEIPAFMELWSNNLRFEEIPAF